MSVGDINVALQPRYRHTASLIGAEVSSDAGSVSREVAFPIVVAMFSSLDWAVVRGLLRHKDRGVFDCFSMSSGRVFGRQRRIERGARQTIEGPLKYAVYRQIWPSQIDRSRCRWTIPLC